MNLRFRLDLINLPTYFLISKCGTFLRHWLNNAEAYMINRSVSRLIGSNISLISSYTLPGELVSLYRLAQSRNEGASLLEIGSHLGKSACFICAAILKKSGRIYCVDTWNNETMPEGQMDTFSRFCANTKAFNSFLYPIRKHSNLLKKSDLPSCVELVFIDGDHSYEGARNDFQKVEKLVPSNGVVAFHDAVSPHFPGVARVIGEALASGEWTIGGQTNTLFWICRR